MTRIYKAFIHCQLLENGRKGIVLSSILQVPSNDYPFFSDLCKSAFECCTNQKLTISTQDIKSAPLSDPAAASTGYCLKIVLLTLEQKRTPTALAACHLALLPISKSHEARWRKWTVIQKWQRFGSFILA